MLVVWLDQTDGPGGQDSHDQGGRHDASIVAVELDLRQDIHQSDADKDSRVQAMSPAKHLWLRCTDSLDAEVAGDGSKRTKQGIAKVDGYSAHAAKTSRCHDRVLSRLPQRAIHASENETTSPLASCRADRSSWQELPRRRTLPPQPSAASGGESRPPSSARPGSSSGS